MSKKYFTSGEFATVCGTTKETLFHYDEIGILKPTYVAKNGYRYYSPKQFYDFDLIATLKEAGSSLAQIKEYIETYTPENYLKILEMNREKLRQERLKLMRMERLLKNSEQLTKYAMQTPVGLPKLEECEEEYFIVVKLNTTKPISEIDEIYEIADHFKYCFSHKLGDEFPLGSIVLKETLLSGQSYDSYYYSKIYKPVKSERLFIKPKGTYLTMLHRGFMDTIEDSYKLMLDYIEKNNLELIGNAYCYDVLSYLATCNTNDFVIQISMQVERKK